MWWPQPCLQFHLFLSCWLTHDHLENFGFSQIDHLSRVKSLRQHRQAFLLVRNIINAEKFLFKASYDLCTNSRKTLKMGTITWPIRLRKPRKKVLPFYLFKVEYCCTGVLLFLVAYNFIFSVLSCSYSREECIL